VCEPASRSGKIYGSSASANRLELFRLDHHTVSGMRIASSRYMQTSTRRAVCALAAIVHFGFACSAAPGPELKSLEVVGDQGASTGAKPSQDAGTTPGETRTDSGTEAKTTTCDLNLSIQAPSALRDLKAFGIKIGKRTTGADCTLEIDGVKRDSTCGSTFALNGGDLGVGIHAIKLRVASGPSGAAECTKKFWVPELAACRVVDEYVGTRIVHDLNYDTYGRRVAEVTTWVMPALGQQIWAYGYEGATNKLVSQSRTFSNYVGVPNSRKDTFTRIYEPGTPDAFGVVNERVKTIDFDDNSDGKIELRQTYRYDAAGYNNIIDEDAAADGSVDNRYTFEYNPRGLVANRKSDEKADGTVDATAEWNYDALGVLIKIASTGSQVFTVTPQYACD
jgi:hypothetical protein